MYNRFMLLKAGVLLLSCINFGLCSEDPASLDYRKTLSEQLQLGCDIIMSRRTSQSSASEMHASLAAMQMEKVGITVESCVVKGFIFNMSLLVDEGKFLQRKRCNYNQDFNYFASNCHNTGSALRQSSPDCIRSMMPKTTCADVSGYAGSREIGVFVGVPLGLIFLGGAILLVVFLVRKRRYNQLSQHFLVASA